MGHCQVMQIIKDWIFIECAYKKVLEIRNYYWLYSTDRQWNIVFKLFNSKNEPSLKSTVVASICKSKENSKAWILVIEIRLVYFLINYLMLSYNTC